MPPGPSQLAFNFTQGTTPFMRSILQVAATTRSAPAAAADINAKTVRAITMDVAGNLTAASSAIGRSHEYSGACRHRGSRLGRSARRPGLLGTFVASHSVNSGGRDDVPRRRRCLSVRRCSPPRRSRRPPGWQAPFTGGGLDFWVLEQPVGTRWLRPVLHGHYADVLIGTSAGSIAARGRRVGGRKRLPTPAWAATTSLRLVAMLRATVLPRSHGDHDRPVV